MPNDLFRRAYEKHVDEVWRLLRLYGVPADERQDVAQEVFVALSEKLSELPPSEVRPYLYGIVKNVSWKRRRFQARWTRYLMGLQVALFDLGYHPDPLSPEEQSSRTAEYESAMRLLDKLSAKHREAFFLHAVQALTLEEVARQTGTNPDTVSSRVREARKALRKELERESLRNSWRYRWTT